MSTRAFIGIKNEDGTVRAVYSHWDNYVAGTGEVLFMYYTTEDRINKLLDLGDMSSIGTEPVGTWDDENARDYSKCYTYRERGETGVDARTYTDEEAFLDSCCEDYTYLFKNGEWFYRNWDDELKPLKNEF